MPHRFPLQCHHCASTTSIEFTQEFIRHKISKLTLHFLRLSAHILLETHVRLAKIAKRTGRTGTESEVMMILNVNVLTAHFAIVYRATCDILTPVPIELISQRKYTRLRR